LISVNPSSEEEKEEKLKARDLQNQAAMEMKNLLHFPDLLEERQRMRGRRWRKRWWWWWWWWWSGGERLGMMVVMERGGRGRERSHSVRCHLKGSKIHSTNFLKLKIKIQVFYGALFLI